MSVLRYSISALVLLGLAAGYAASQLAFFSGQAAEFARAVDRPAVKWLALGVLLTAILFAFISEKDGVKP
jgi:hypothetical protein